MNQQERAKAIESAQNQAKEGGSLRPAPSDPAYRDWAGKNNVKREQDPHYAKARSRGEVK